MWHESCKSLSVPWSGFSRWRWSQESRNAMDDHNCLFVHEMFQIFWSLTSGWIGDAACELHSAYHTPYSHLSLVTDGQILGDHGNLPNRCKDILKLIGLKKAIHLKVDQLLSFQPLRFQGCLGVLDLFEGCEGLSDCDLWDGIREMDGTLRYIPGELEGSTCTAGIEEINRGPAGHDLVDIPASP